MEKSSAAQQWRDKLDALADEFEIKDREALMATIGRAMSAMAENSDGMKDEAGQPIGNGIPDFREGDTLDELEELLRPVIELLADPLNGNRLAQHLRSSSTAGPSYHIPDLIRQLQVLGREAAEAHREREQKTGQLPRADLSAATIVLADYWKMELGRPFKTNHAWKMGAGGQIEPVTKCEWFVLRAIRTFTQVDGAEIRRAIGRR